MIPVTIHLRHGSIALPMLGVPKMSVGVTLPHFTSPSSNGGQIGFFNSALNTKQKKSGGTIFRVSREYTRVTLRNARVTLPPVLPLFHNIRMVCPTNTPVQTVFFKDLIVRWTRGVQCVKTPKKQLARMDDAPTHLISCPRETTQWIPYGHVCAICHSPPVGLIGGALSAVRARCARSATIWASGRSRNPYFVVLWASLLFGSRF